MREDVENLHIEKVACLCRSVSCFALVVYAQRYIFLSGGSEQFNGREIPVDFVTEIDPEADLQFTAPSLSHARMYHSSISQQNFVYALGGYIGYPGQLDRSVDCFDFETRQGWNIVIKSSTLKRSDFAVGNISTTEFIAFGGVDRKTNKWAKNVLFLNLKNNNLELRSQSNSSMRFKTLN